VSFFAASIPLGHSRFLGVCWSAIIQRAGSPFLIFALEAYAYETT
jgi:hypothetical protein